METVHHESSETQTRCLIAVALHQSPNVNDPFHKITVLPREEVCSLIGPFGKNNMKGSFRQFKFFCFKKTSHLIHFDNIFKIIFVFQLPVDTSILHFSQSVTQLFVMSQRVPKITLPYFVRSNKLVLHLLHTTTRCNKEPTLAGIQCFCWRL